MTRLEKCELLKSKGYTYDAETGKIYGSKGKIIKSVDTYGYNIIKNKNWFQGEVKGHHFAWYMMNGNVDFNELDHINRNPHDNRIVNLRSSNRKEQQYNRNSKGYTYRKDVNKYLAQIQIGGKNKYLGYFNSEEEASKVYLMEKQKI